MNVQQRRSGWRIWLYLTPVYVALAVPLFKWAIRVNSGDINLSKDAYRAFNSEEGDIKKPAAAAQDPGLSDLGYSIRYRSGKGGAGGDTAPETRTGTGVRTDVARSGNAAGQYRPQPAPQAALTSRDTSDKTYFSVGAQRGYLLSAVGKMMGSPRAVSALMNNSWVVKGFMGRATTRAALGSPQGLKNYLSNRQNVDNFLNNPVVRSAMNNPAMINAFAGSAMAGAILASPAAQDLLRDQQAVSQLVAQNPQMLQALSNPNVMNALMNNPQTAALAGALGGGGQGQHTRR